MNLYVVEDFFLRCRVKASNHTYPYRKKNYSRVDLNDKCFEADVLS